MISFQFRTSSIYCISSINYVKISTIVAKPLQIKNNVFFLKDLLYYIIFSYTTSIAYTLKFQHYYTYTIMLISCNFLTFSIIRLRFFAIRFTLYAIYDTLPSPIPISSHSLKNYNSSLLLQSLLLQSGEK